MRRKRTERAHREKQEFEFGPYHDLERALEASRSRRTKFWHRLLGVFPLFAVPYSFFILGTFWRADIVQPFGTGINVAQMVPAQFGDASAQTRFPALGWFMITLPVIGYFLLWLLIRPHARHLALSREIALSYEERLRAGLRDISRSLRLVRQVHFAGNDALQSFFQRYAAAGASLAEAEKSVESKDGREILADIAGQFTDDQPTTILAVIDGNMRIRLFREETNENKPPGKFWFLLLYFALFDCLQGDGRSNQVARVFTYKITTRPWVVPLHQLCLHILNVLNGVTTLVEVDFCTDCGPGQTPATQSPSPNDLTMQWQKDLQPLVADNSTHWSTEWKFCTRHWKDDTPLYGLDYVVIPRRRHCSESNRTEGGNLQDAAVLYLDFGRKDDARGLKPGFAIRQPIFADIFKADFEHRLNRDQHNDLHKVSVESLLEAEPYDRAAEPKRLEAAIDYLLAFFIITLRAADARNTGADVDAIREQWQMLNAHTKNTETENLNLLEQVAKRQLGRLEKLKGAIRHASVERARRA